MEAILAAALILTSAILLCAIVRDEAWLVVTELGNSLRVAATGVLGRNGRHVCRGYGYPPRHRTRVTW
jgi:hypothetical protein